MDSELYEVLRQALRIVLLASLPVVISVCIAGVLSGFLQAVSGVYDWSISYAARVLALGIAISIFFVGFARELASFATMLFGATTQ
jgi:type III secretory pathway component EscS